MSPHIEQCPLCTRAVHTISTSVPGYQRGTEYRLYECEGCLSSFAAPLASDDPLYNLIYENIRYVPGYNRYFSYAHTVLRQQNPLAYLSSQEESYWAVAQQVTARRAAGEELNILEVGCGMGYFSYALHRAGFTVTGVDLSVTAIAWAREHYGPFYECSSLESLHTSGRRYDVIVMNQLIEHVPEPHQFIAEALALLAPRGELLLTTPNKSAYPGALWETELPPVHLWWFGEEAMKFIARKHNCAVELIDFSEFNKSFARIKTYGTPLGDRQAVFDERGTLLVRQTIPVKSPWHKLLEQSGRLEQARRLRMKIKRGQTWQGACGPICACVLRPLQVKHD